MSPKVGIKFQRFASAKLFRDWLTEHSAGATEVLVGFFNKTSGKPGMTYPQAVDEALCFGWIDGIRRNVNADTYTVRFTPRKLRSIWSRKNILRAQELRTLGRMTVTGLKAFEKRDPKRSGVYSFENRQLSLDPAFEREFKANGAAWDYYQTRPPWYRKTASWWVMSAKTEETRRRRMQALISDSASNRSIKPLTRREKAA